MSLNTNLASPALSPHQQDSPLPAVLPPSSPDVANPSEPALSNHTAANSPLLITNEVNQSAASIAEHSAPEKSDRSSSASSEADSANSDDEIASLKKAAAQGDAQAQFDLGESYDDGDGVKENKEKAFKWYSRAAEQGHVDAQYNLGILYANGEGVQPNDKLAFKWFQKAADQGDPCAQYMLGQMYRSGRSVLKDKVKAAEWFEKSANQGHVEAQGILGYMYLQGLGVEKNKVKAAELLSKSAEQDDPSAQHYLALMYQFGKGVKKNQREAVYWFRKSAGQGYAMAQHDLAMIYKNGEGVEKNSEEAFMWCHKAADQNYREAMKSLSSFYKEGQGVAEDLLLATYWMMRFYEPRGGEHIALDGGSELYQFIPNILQNYPQFAYIKTLSFVSLKSSEKAIPSIAKIIESNPKIKQIKLNYLHYLNEGEVRALSEALKFNTNLTHLEYPSEELSKEIVGQLELLLTQNNDIAELRKYVDDHPLIYTVDIPTEVIEILDEQIIVSYIKSGQTKEATKKAIDEFLIIAGMTPLANDSKIT